MKKELRRGSEISSRFPLKKGDVCGVRELSNVVMDEEASAGSIAVVL